jgi:RimJ/RimL family protein N-acetyltransferase
MCNEQLATPALAQRTSAWQTRREPPAVTCGTSVTAEQGALNDDLFAGRLVRLTAFNSEADAEIIARWSRDTEYHRLGDNDWAYPQSVRQARERLERDSDRSFGFAIRTLSDDRLIGDIGVWVESWVHGEGWVGIGLGERNYWGNGYGTAAMRLMLRFAFDELNLQRVSLGVYAYNPRAIRSYEKAGFRREGVVRGDCRRDGQQWDTVFMGVLRDEWLQRET